MLQFAIWEIASEDCHRGTNIRGANTATVISDCDIMSEGIQSDRRKVFMIGRGFFRSEKDFYASEGVQLYWRGVL